MLSNLSIIHYNLIKTYNKKQFYWLEKSCVYKGKKRFVATEIGSSVREEEL